MTLPPVIRIFFAVELSLDIKQKLAGLITILKKKSKTNAIRWTMPENLHITLQFLKEVHSEHLEQLIQNVRHQLQGNIKAFKFVLNGLELFPSPYRPRVIVLKVASHEHLTYLAERIGRGILTTHYEIDDRPFQAHLTLGRMKHPTEINVNFLTECKPPIIEAIEMKEVVLFRSEPQPEGSKYRVLERISL